MNRGIGRYIPPMGYAVMQREKEEAEQKARAAERRRAEDAVQAAQVAEHEAAEEEDQRAAEAQAAQVATEQAEVEARVSVPPADDDPVEPPPPAPEKAAGRRQGARTAPPPPRRKKKASEPKAAAGRRPGTNRAGRQLAPRAPEPPLAPLLTTPALLASEDPAEYADLLAGVIEEVQPGDAVEYLLLHDFVGRSWEVKRYGRLKASYLSSRAPDALGFLLRDLQVSEPDRARLIKGWLSGDPAARAEIRTLLAAAGWDETVIDARSLGMSLKVIDGIESQLIMAEASRANAWRALIRHRADLAERFAQPQALIDGVYSDCTNDPDGTDFADVPDGTSRPDDVGEVE